MQLCIVGGGFVGTTSATVFSEWGHSVVLVEADAGRREALAAGRLPFYEAGLEEAWAAADVEVVGSLAEAGSPSLVFLCVGTPSLPDGGADLEFLREASIQVAKQGWDTPVVVKSTVPPGTTRDVVTPLVSPAAMNPEFLREGCAFQDAREPDRVVLGVQDAISEERLRTLYAGVNCPIVVTDPTTAEMIKYGANAMLATRNHNHPKPSARLSGPIEYISAPTVSGDAWKDSNAYATQNRVARTRGNYLMAPRRLVESDGGRCDG